MVNVTAVMHGVLRNSSCLWSTNVVAACLKLQAGFIHCQCSLSKNVSACDGQLAVHVARCVRAIAA